MSQLYDRHQITLDSLRSLTGRLPDYSDPVLFESVLEKALIEARIVNGSYELTPRARLTIGMPGDLCRVRSLRRGRFKDQSA